MPPMLCGVITQGNAVVGIDYPNWTLSYWPDNSINESQVNQATCQYNAGGPNAIFGNANLEIGACMLNNALTSTSGQKIVFGHSLGCAVATRWLVEYGPTADISPDELMFVFIGNSSRAYGGYVYVNGGQASVEWAGISGTPYQVLDIARQFDGWADWPDETTNFIDWNVAAQNAQIGMNTLHDFYQNVSINDPNNAFYQVGNVTYVINPTPLLPMANQWFYTKDFQQQVDKQYRPDIYNAYSYYEKFVIGGGSTNPLISRLPAKLSTLLNSFLPSWTPPDVPEFPPQNRNDLPTINRRNYDSVMVPINLGPNGATGPAQPPAPQPKTPTEIAVQIYTTMFHSPAVPAQITNSGNGVFTLEFGNVAMGPPNGGMFVLSYGAHTTSPIIFSETGDLMALGMEGALWALPNVGWGGVNVSALTDTDFTFRFTTPSGDQILAIGDNSGSPYADPAGLGGEITQLINLGEDQIDSFIQGVFGIPGVSGYSTAVEI